MSRSPECGYLSLSALLFAACTTAPSPTPTLPQTPTERLAAVRASEDQIRTLRSRFSSVVHTLGGDRSADGVLLVAKPDRFRLRLLLPFGITVFDYLNVGEQTWTALPLAGDQDRARVDQFAAFTREDLGQAFLRGPYAFPGTCEAAPAPNDKVSVRCHDGTGLRRTLLIGAHGIDEEASYDGAALRLVIRYADYRTVDSAALPFHITLEYPQREQRVDITIDQYEVNPQLSEELFRPLDSATR